MEEKITQGSGEMFDRIATRYDLLNRVLSMGLDIKWRNTLAKSLKDVLVQPNAEVLDVATGTADIAITIAKHYPEINIVGLDPSAEMLGIGRQKVTEHKLSSRIQLIEGDAQAMDFEDNRFNATTISFGIRNVPDRKKGLKEMARVTKKGGLIAILEFSEPQEGIIAKLASFHVHHILPKIGALFTKGGEYQYLQESIEAFPLPDEWIKIMEECGIGDVKVKAMGFDTVKLFVGTVL